MKMTWLQLFGLLLFSAHVYGRSQLAATTSYVILTYDIENVKNDHAPTFGMTKEVFS